MKNELYGTANALSEGFPSMAASKDKRLVSTSSREESLSTLSNFGRLLRVEKEMKSESCTSE